MSSTPRIPDGDRIATEVETEMEAQLYPLRKASLPPSEYYVYLNPDDFQRIEAIVPRIVRDVQTCLNERVEALNSPSWWRRIVGGRPAPIEIPPAGWAVHIRPAANGELNPGDLGILSRLALPVPVTFGSGAKTMRVAHTVVSGTDRRTSVREETESPNNSGGSGEPKLGKTIATLTYKDEAGRHVFEMRTDRISIGRGGSGHWADLRVVASPKVSREHCAIRRDPSGRFLLQDFSDWGTFVDGGRVPTTSGPTGAAGTKGEIEISSGAVITLADGAVTLEFHVP